MNILCTLYLPLAHTCWPPKLPTQTSSPPPLPSQGAPQDRAAVLPDGRRLGLRVRHHPGPAVHGLVLLPAQAVRGRPRVPLVHQELLPKRRRLQLVSERRVGRWVPIQRELSYAWASRCAQRTMGTRARTNRRHFDARRNFGIAKAVTGKFNEAEEALSSIQNEKYRLVSWLG